MTDIATSNPDLPTPKRPLLQRVDKVVAATAVLLAAIASYSMDQAAVSVWFVVEALFSIAPFLAASVAFAAGAKASGLDQPIAAAFRKNMVTAIVLASLLGAFSPFCSCGVIPIIAGLLNAGVPLAPVMAFWLSSPLMDPEMFILMTGGIGLQFTLAKTVAAAVLGLASGFTVAAFSRTSFVTSPLKDGVAASTCGSTCGAPEADTRVVWTFWRDRERLATFTSTARETAWFLIRWLTLAFLIESLMVAYMPPEMVAGWLGSSQWWVIPMSSIIGVPAYLNGYAAIPLVRGLMDVGMLPGAALAFMIAGGVTSIPAAMAVFVVVKRGVFALYVALGFAGAMASGWAYQTWLAI